MTSKASFIKMLREDMKRRIWPLALSFTGFFFALPILALIEIEQLTSDMAYRTDTLANIQAEFITTIIGAYNYMAVFGLLIMALICGLHGMKYLHSKQEADFYGGVPILRTTRYTAAYINGILITLVPYILMHVLAAIIGLSRGFVTGRGLAYGASTMLLHSILFICVYSVVVLAAILTGHGAVSVAASAVLLFGPISYALLLEGYAENFFITKYTSVENWPLLLSPVTAYGYISLSVEQYYNGIWLLLYAVLGLGAAILSVVLYFAGRALIKIRKAEVAGRAMAFEKTRPWIKVFIMIPVALLFGILFNSISNVRAYAWLVFGLVVGLVLSHVVIEMIYEFDLKACRKHLFSSLAGVVLTALIASFFVFDLSSYDTRLPEQGKVESAAIEIRGLNEVDGYGGYLGYGQDYNVSTQDIVLDSMVLEDIDSVYVLARYGSDFAGQNRMNRNNKNYARIRDYQEEYEGSKFTEVVVNLRQRNGREFRRIYYIDTANNDNFTAIKNIYESRAFKEGEYPVTKGLDIDGKYSILYDTPTESWNLDKLTQAEQDTVLDALAQDTLDMTMETVQYEVPIYVMNIQIERNEDSQYDYERYEYYTLGAVYPSFKRTLPLLEKAGVKYGKEIDPAEVDHVETYTYIDDEEITETLSYAETTQVLPNLVPTDYAYTNSAFCKIDYDISYEVTMRDETTYMYYLIEKDPRDLV